MPTWSPKDGCPRRRCAPRAPELPRPASCSARLLAWPTLLEYNADGEATGAARRMSRPTGETSRGPGMTTVRAIERQVLARWCRLPRGAFLYSPHRSHLGKKRHGGLVVMAPRTQGTHLLV
jgi:hypothetical protein